MICLLLKRKQTVGDIKPAPSNVDFYVQSILACTLFFSEFYGKSIFDFCIISPCT